MGIIKEVKQSIWGKKTLYFIVYIQLVVVFFATIFAGINIAYMTDYLSRIRRIVEPTWVKPMIIDVYKQDELMDQPETVEKLYNFFLSSGEVKKVGALWQEHEGILNPHLFQENGRSSKTIVTVSIDEFFLESLEKKVHSGRNLIDEDYSKDLQYIPVLVAHNLRRKYKLGSIIENKYEVVGVLRRNTSMPTVHEGFFTFGTIDSNYLVAPKLPMDFDNYPDSIPEDFKTRLINASIFNHYFACIYIELKDESSIESFASSVEDKGNELGIPLILESLHKTTKERINSDLPRALPTIYVAVVAIILSIVGQVAVNLSLVFRKKREFGIKLACGASLGDICRVILLEMLLLIVMALATSFSMVIAIAKDANKHMSISELIRDISPTAYMITLITTLIIFIVVSIVPILRIRKMEPTELIREV